MERDLRDRGAERSVRGRASYRQGVLAL